MKNLENKATLNIRQRFARNFLDILVLVVIKSRPTWGYQIIKGMQENFSVKIGYGTMYPLLKSLTVKGLIQNNSKKGDRRKIYKITVKGLEVINSYKELLEDQLQMLKG